MSIQNELQLFQSNAFKQFKELAEMKESDFQTRVGILKGELSSM